MTHKRNREGQMMNIFPPPITKLPEAVIPISGIRAFLSQSQNHQILFMQFGDDVDLPEHRHASQLGIVLEGKIELKVNGITTTYVKGDRYYLPENLPHSGKIHAGYADVTFFDEPDRYEVKKDINRALQRHCCQGHYELCTDKILDHHTSSIARDDNGGIDYKHYRKVATRLRSDAVTSLFRSLLVVFQKVLIHKW